MKDNKKALLEILNCKRINHPAGRIFVTMVQCPVCHGEGLDYNGLKCSACMGYKQLWLEPEGSEIDPAYMRGFTMCALVPVEIPYMLMGPKGYVYV